MNVKDVRWLGPQQVIITSATVKISCRVQYLTEEYTVDVEIMIHFADFNCLNI